jgi:hypothetical protein
MSVSQLAKRISFASASSLPTPVGRRRIKTMETTERMADRGAFADTVWMRLGRRKTLPTSEVDMTNGRSSSLGSNVSANHLMLQYSPTAIEARDVDFVGAAFRGVGINRFNEPEATGGTGRHPIPEDWYRIEQRQSFAGKKPKNNNALRPVNAILNYAYAVLESQVRIQVLSAGYDPTIGLLHSGREGRGTHDFVLDLMEPLRPILDQQVLGLIFLTFLIHSYEGPLSTSQSNKSPSTVQGFPLRQTDGTFFRSFSLRM